MSDAQPHWELESIPDLLGRVPQLLGFHPSDSGVIVGIRGQYIHLVARLDLPAPPVTPRPALPVPADGTAAVLHQVAAECAAQDVTDVVVLGYGEEPPVVAMFDAATAVCTVRGLAVMHLVRVTGERYVEHDRRQLADGGDEVPFDRHATGPHVPGAPQPAADREALAAAVAPLQGHAASAMADAVAAASARPVTGGDGRRPGRVAVDAAVRGSEHDGTLPDAAAAELIVLLREPGVREYAFTRTDGDDQRHLQLWLDLTRRATPGFVAAPACLAAYAAWRTYQPMLARLAVDRALLDDPGNRLAALIHVILSLGMPPEMAEGISARRRASGTQQ